MRSESIKIFIIDDDQSVCEILKEYLSLSEFIVDYSINPIEGLNKIRNFKPDLILLDLEMPVKNGFEVLKEIRWDKSFSNTGVILLTSHDHINYKIKGLEEGADDYITKPFHKTEVLARIRTIVRRLKLAQQKDDVPMSGDLKNFTLIDILQFFDINKKSGTIKLLNMDSEIIILNGSIVFSRYKKFTDIEALKRLLLYNYGRFEVEFDKINNDNFVNSVKISDVLLDILSSIDELKRGLGPEFMEDTIIEIKDDKILEKFETDKRHINVLELLGLYPYDLSEGLFVLKNLLFDKINYYKDELP